MLALNLKWRLFYLLCPPRNHIRRFFPILLKTCVHPNFWYLTQWRIPLINRGRHYFWSSNICMFFVPAMALGRKRNGRSVDKKITSSTVWIELIKYHWQNTRERMIKLPTVENEDEEWTFYKQEPATSFIESFRVVYPVNSICHNETNTSKKVSVLVKTRNLSILSCSSCPTCSSHSKNDFKMILPWDYICSSINCSFIWGVDTCVGLVMQSCVNYACNGQWSVRFRFCSWTKIKTKWYETFWNDIQGDMMGYLLTFCLLDIMKLKMSSSDMMWIPHQMPLQELDQLTTGSSAAILQVSQKIVWDFEGLNSLGIPLPNYLSWISFLHLELFQHAHTFPSQREPREDQGSCRVRGSVSMALKMGPWTRAILTKLELPASSKGASNTTEWRM